MNRNADCVFEITNFEFEDLTEFKSLFVHNITFCVNDVCIIEVPKQWTIGVIEEYFDTYSIMGRQILVSRDRCSVLHQLPGQDHVHIKSVSIKVTVGNDATKLHQKRQPVHNRW
jgi:hypothetical protein